MQLRHVKDIEYQLLPGADRQTTDIVIERDGIITVASAAMDDTGASGRNRV